jgi:NAD-reducing hydrogenase large subunit
MPCISSISRRPTCSSVSRASPAGATSSASLRAYPEVARQGVLLRKFGQEVIRLTAGKRVHGTGAIPGGVNRSLSGAERDACWPKSTPSSTGASQAVHLVKRLHTANPALYDVFGTFRSNILSLVGADGALDFYEGRLRARDADGKIIVDAFPVSDYQQLIHEEVKPWSYMKFPFLAALGPQAGWYKVGPLARVQNCDSIPTPLAEGERREFIDHGQGQLIHAPLAYHWARMIELLHAAETIRDLLTTTISVVLTSSPAGAPRTRGSASSRRRAAR